MLKSGLGADRRASGDDRRSVPGSRVQILRRHHGDTGVDDGDDHLAAAAAVMSHAPGMLMPLKFHWREYDGSFGIACSCRR